MIFTILDQGVNKVTEIHLDYDVLIELQEIMADDYRSLVETFLNDSEVRMTQLHQATNAADLELTAHSFKGSCGNLGAARLAELCADLEERAKHLPLIGVDELMRKIDMEFATVKPLYALELQRFHC